MGKHINNATHAITNNVTGLNICYLFSNNLFSNNLLGNNLLLNSKNKRENRSANKSNDNVFSKEELITTV